MKRTYKIEPIKDKYFVVTKGIWPFKWYLEHRGYEYYRFVRKSEATFFQTFDEAEQAAKTHYKQELADAKSDKDYKKRVKLHKKVNKPEKITFGG